jgi:hypothetical protein
VQRKSLGHPDTASRAHVPYNNYLINPSIPSILNFIIIVLNERSFKVLQFERTKNHVLWYAHTEICHLWFGIILKKNSNKNIADGW